MPVLAGSCRGEQRLILLQRLAHGRMPTLVIFDLDGTLVNSVPDLATAIDLMLDDLNLPIAGATQVCQWVGNGAAALVERAVNYGVANDTSPKTAVSCRQLARAMSLFIDHYQRHCARQTHLYPGALACLEQLHQRQIAIAIVTNKPRRFVSPILCHLAIDQFFSQVVAGDDLPTRKPDPQPLYYCLRHHQICAENAVMVGDSRNDILAARGADMAVAAVDYGYNHGQSISASKPDALMASLTELLV